jgi:hypothetical protein
MQEKPAWHLPAIFLSSVEVEVLRNQNNLGIFIKQMENLEN